MRTSLAHGGVGLLVALPLLLLLAAPVRAQTPPFFEETDCAMVADLAAWRDDDLRCGYVVVPERRQDVTDPSAVNTIRLAVVVLPATGAAPADDPLFVAQGGPGGSTIDVFTDLLLDSPLRDRRDIVLFDQRGTLYSDPNLICTEVQARRDELFMASDEEYPALLAQVTSDCRARLTAAGIDVAAYNSLENAADVDDIRRALGYEDINFYGVSYGTLLGFHLMRMFPDHLRSVILDGVVPPQVNFITESAASEERVFAAFFPRARGRSLCRRVRRSGNALLRSGGRAQCTAGRPAHPPPRRRAE
ncbi:MAG: alpha/beta fold hydrolase [Caldilineaceae bacterium]